MFQKFCKELLRGIGTGSGCCSGRDPLGAEDSAACLENLGGRRISGTEAGVRAQEAQARARASNRRQTHRCQGGLVSVSMLDRWADLCLNVPLSAFREGLRTKLGELACVGAASCVLLHDVPNQKNCNILIMKDKIRITNFGAYS